MIYPPCSESIARQVLHIISQRTSIPVKRLRLNLHLSRELYFDLLDIVDIILDLEHSFHVHIPDEVPFVTIRDFVDYVAAHAGQLFRHSVFTLKHDAGLAGCRQYR